MLSIVTSRNSGRSISESDDRCTDSRLRYESYLSHSDPVVLTLNPFFVLEYVFRMLLTYL